MKLVKYEVAYTEEIFYQGYLVFLPGQLQGISTSIDLNLESWNVS